jgi:acid phosphatase type 7
MVAELGEDYANRLWFFDSFRCRSWNVHRVGNTTILALDSGINLYPDNPDQIDFMKRELSQPFYYNKIALYHVPLYPSIYLNNPLASALRTAWLSIFDENQVTVAFENHDHAYKRSKLLKDGKVINFCYSS